jgi:hypothetical protein
MRCGISGDQNEVSGQSGDRDHAVLRRSSHTPAVASKACDVMATSLLHSSAATLDSAVTAAAGENCQDDPKHGMKSRRAAALRSDVFRQQLLSPEKANVANMAAGAGVGVGSSPSKSAKAAAVAAASLQSPDLAMAPPLTWEGKGTRTRSAKPRKHFTSILRSDRYETPHFVQQQSLENRKWQADVYVQLLCVVEHTICARITVTIAAALRFPKRQNVRLPRRTA